MIRGLLAFLLVAQDPDLPELVRRLADDDVEVRAQAARRIHALPARLLPELESEARKRPEAEVEAVVARLRIPAAWTRILRGTMGEARRAFDRISSPGHPEREAAIRKAVADLETLPPADAPEALEGLLALDDEETRRFALRCMARVPPRDPALLAPFLRDARTTGLAAEILVRMNDRSLVPLAVDLFCDEGPGTLGAARLLEHFGAGERWPRVAAALRAHVGLLTWGIRILARSGEAAEAPLLELMASASPHRKIEIAAALAEVGGRKSLPAAREALRAARPDERDRLHWLLRDPEWAVERLALAKSDFRHARDWPLDRLAQAGGPALRGPLLRWLMEDGLDPAIEAELLALLGGVGEPADAEFLLRRLDAEDRNLAWKAAEGLDRLADPAHARAMFAAARRTGSPVLGRALIPLARGVPEADLVDALLHERQVLNVIDAARRMSAARLTPRVREALFERTLEGWPLERIGKFRVAREGSAEAVLLLAPGLRPEEKRWMERLRADAVPSRRALGLFLAVRSGDAAARPELEKALEGEPDLARALGRSRPVPAAALDAVEKAIAEGGLPGEEALAEFVARAGPERWERLARGVDPAKPEGLALLLLARAARPEGRPFYRKVVARRETESFWFDKVSSPAGPCARALGRLGAKEAAPDLRLLLRSPVAATRAQAAEALALLGDREAVPGLTLLVDDPVPVTGRYPHPSDGIFPVRRVWHAAMEALEKLTGVPSEGASVADRRAFWRSR